MCKWAAVISAPSNAFRRIIEKAPSWRLLESVDPTAACVRISSKPVSQSMSQNASPYDSVEPSSDSPTGGRLQSRHPIALHPHQSLLGNHRTTRLICSKSAFLSTAETWAGTESAPVASPETTIPWSVLPPHHPNPSAPRTTASGPEPHVQAGPH